MYYLVSILYQKRHSLFFIFLLILITSYFLHTPAFAQTPPPLNLTASPTVFDLILKPGDSITKTVRIRNNNASATSFSVTLKKIIPDKGGQLIVQDFKKEDAYQSWLSVNNSNLIAAPKEWTDIPFTLTIPKDAAFGYYWAIVIAPQVPQQNTTIPGAHITGAVAIPVLLAVQNTGTIFGGRLLQFTADNPIYEYLPTTFTTTFQNTSNVHIRPTGDIFITDWTGKQVGFIKVNPDQGAILPNAKRDFTTMWNDSFITQDPKIEDGKIMTDTKGHPQSEIHFHFDRVLSLRIGKYKATELLVVSGDKKDISFEQTTTFFVFPWKIIGGALLFVLLAGLGLWNTIHAVWRHGRKVFKKQS